MLDNLLAKDMLSTMFSGQVMMLFRDSLNRRNEILMDATLRALYDRGEKAGIVNSVALYLDDGTFDSDTESAFSNCLVNSLCSLPSESFRTLGLLLREHLENGPLYLEGEIPNEITEDEYEIFYRFAVFYGCKEAFEKIVEEVGLEDAWRAIVNDEDCVGCDECDECGKALSYMWDDAVERHGSLKAWEDFLRKIFSGSNLVCHTSSDVLAEWISTLNDPEFLKAEAVQRFKKFGTVTRPVDNGIPKELEERALKSSLPGDAFD